MKDEEQFRKELVELRQRVTELEKLESQCRQAEETLRETEARYHSIFENAVEGIFSITLDGRILAANPAAARMLGYGSPEELIAEVTDIRQIYIDLNRRDELIHLMQTKGVVTGFEVQIRRKDGSMIWTSANIQASRDESGRIVGFVGMGVNITERKQAEEKLRDSEIRYRTLFEQSPDGVLIIDPQTAAVIEFNETAHRQLGYTREEFKTLRIFDYEAKEKLEETKAHIEKVLHEGRDDLETLHRAKDGKLRNVMVTVKKIELSGMEVLHCIFRDITELKRIEEALRESQNLLQSTMDNFPTVIAYKDREGRFLNVNKIVENVLGMTKEQIRGLTDYDLFPKERADIYRRRDLEVMESRQPMLREEVTELPSGNLYHLDTSFPLIDSEGHVYGVGHISHDITELKRTEDALRKERDKAQKYLDIAGVMIVVIDANQKVTLANKKCCEILGYRENEIIGRNWFNTFLPERIRSEVKATFAKLMAGEIALVEFFENPILTRSGEERVIFWHNTVLRDEAGNIIGTLSSGEDITERKRAEEALLESEMRYRTLFEKAGDAILILKVEGEDAGKIIAANQAAAEMHGYTVDELLTLSITDLDAPEAAKGTPDRIRRTLRGEWIKEEITHRRKDGTVFPVEISGGLIDFGNYKYILSFDRDITEHKRAEKALENYAAKLKEANRLKDLFIDIMRHDLLNPLGIIKTASEQMLLMETRDEKIRNTLPMIKRSADKLIDMIKSASMYAMLENTEKLEKSSIDLNEIFAAVVNNFKPQLEEKNMKLEYISKGGCCIMANPMVDGVFSNLLSNAIKYSPAGGKIEVRIINEKEHFRIDVKDWGYGIKDGDKEKLFTRFQRVDKKGVKGTGLGLAIVKRVVELHEGRVWIEDNPEGGSVFCVEIPKISGSASVRFPAGE